MGNQNDLFGEGSSGPAAPDPAQPVVSVPVAASSPLKVTVPAVLHSIRIPSMKPKSPMRFIMNALFAALPAASRVNQWPMSK